MNKDVFYNMDIQTLKKYLIDNINNPNIILLLNDNIIKKKILELNYQEFYAFFVDLPFKVITNLLDKDGIEILIMASSRTMKIKAIIEIYFNEPDLFRNELFCDIVIRENFFGTKLFDNISVETIFPFFKYILVTNKSYLSDVLKDFERIQLELVKRVKISYNQLLDVINIGTKETAQYLVNFDSRIKSLLDFNFYDLDTLLSKGIIFPKHLLYEDKFLNFLTSLKDVRKYRLFINSLAENHNVSFIEEMRKKFYENEINTYDENEDMLARYSECYRELLERYFNKSNINNIYTVLENYFGMADSNSHIESLIESIKDTVLIKDNKKLRSLLQEESHLQLTNMIIDYHFEDITYNIFLDIQELVNFNSKVRVILDEEVLRYNKILHLDSLSYQEAKELYEELKCYHYSQFYDHIRMAKDKAIDLMSQAILNEETIQEYKDEELSNKHGVDIYVLSGDEYYALVRSFRVYKDNILENDDVFYSEDGGSYTLDGSIKRNTYCDPRSCYNLIYSSFPKSQIVHVFSVDSFSLYSRNKRAEATSRVYEIRTPEDLINASRHYNEIIIAKPNSYKTDELNLSLQNPKVLGIYCFDEIVENDVLSAKNLNIGIVLVKTSMYTQGFGQINSLTDENYYQTLVHGSNVNQFDYIRNFSSDDMVYRKKF